MAKKSLTKRISEFFIGKDLDTAEKRAALDGESYKTLAEDFKTEFGDTLENVLKQAKAEKNLEGERESVLAEANAVLTEDTPETTETTAQADVAPVVEATAPETEASQADVLKMVSNLTEKVKVQKATIKTLEQKEETVKPKTVSTKLVAITGGAHSAKYLFGIEAPMFDRAHPWNEVAATKKPIGKWNKKDEEAFMASFDEYGISLSGRITELQESGQLDSLKLEAMDFAGFDGTGWGEQYIVRRQDALIAYLRDLPSITKIFPVRYNVQDKMEMTNSFLTDFSQAYQSGEVFKGKHSVEPMLAQVYDVMFKHMFTDMKKLEREYIGYLNREGSDPIKWSMIEWLMSQTLRKLLNEQNERRVLGARVEPITGVAGHHMFGSDGLIRQLLFNYPALSLLTPFTDLNTYVSATILDTVETLVEKVNQILPSGMGDFRLYMNEKHVPWYLKAYETAYGTKLDYTGALLQVKHHSLGGIVAVPNMGHSCFMFITLPGNIEFYEDRPGEMAGVYFERRLENLISASWWKEGTGAYMVGKKSGTVADQYIFTNDPFTSLAADATKADGATNNYFKTIANTKATAITDIDNKKEGVIYRIVCGNVTFASTIAKATLFSEITDAWTPTAVGDYIEVYWDSTLDSGKGKFVEKGRKVTA